MENIEQNGNGGIIEPTGIPDEPKKDGALDTTRAYINIGKDGWITATIHLSKGLYPIIGFLAEVEDNLRIFFAQTLKHKQEQEQKSKLVQPGFRGFKNIFKR